MASSANKRQHKPAAGNAVHGTKRKHSDDKEVVYIDLCDDDDDEPPVTRVESTKRARMDSAVHLCDGDNAAILTKSATPTRSEAAREALASDTTASAPPTTPPSQPRRRCPSSELVPDWQISPQTSSSHIPHGLPRVSEPPPASTLYANMSLPRLHSPALSRTSEPPPASPSYHAGGEYSPVQEIADSPNLPTSSKWPALSVSQTTSTSRHSSPSPVQPVVQGTSGLGPPAVSLPTPEPTPEKRKLHDIPELADRYVPQTINGVEFKNPRNFSLKPAYWKKWTGKEYVKFAEHIRFNFDPTLFAVESGKSVEEIQHVFSTLVANPLYSAATATKRGEEGMDEIMALYQEFGTPSRPWGVDQDGGSRFRGELSGVGKGAIQVILDNGSKASLSFKQLTKGDVKYLKETLKAEDRTMLWNSD